MYSTKPTLTSKFDPAVRGRKIALFPQPDPGAGLRRPLAHFVPAKVLVEGDGPLVDLVALEFANALGAGGDRLQQAPSDPLVLEVRLDVEAVDKVLRPIN